LSERFEGRIINPDGIEIDLPFWVFKRLKRMRLLERDRETGMRRISARIFGLMALWEGPDYRHDAPLRAYDPSRMRTPHSDGGSIGAFIKALGRDCSGLPHPAIERTREYESDLSHTRLSDEYRWQKAQEVVKAVRARKRAA
jgi:hypothetical protein